MPQGRRKSKKNCPPSQPISSRTKKQRRDPPYCTNLHLVRRRGVLDKENECRRRQPGTPRWFSWLPTIPSRRGRTLHSRPGGHCTALHCTATALGASTIIVDYKPVAKQERNAFLASAACCTKPPNRDGAPLSPSSEKKESHVPAAMHLAENSNHPPTPRSPGQEAERHRPRVSLATRERLCASPCASPASRRAPPSPALLPCFHTSAQNRLTRPAASH